MSYYTLKDGEKLYYEDRGHGPDTLIMMHGWTSTHDVYAKPMELLQEQARGGSRGQLAASQVIVAGLDNLCTVGNLVDAR